MGQNGKYTELDINSHVHKVRYTIFGDNKGKGYTTHVVHGDMVHQNGPAVHVHKIEDFSSGRIMGRLASGSGDCSQLTASSVRSIINVEDGATADQSASEILTLIKTVDGSGSGLDADNLDGRTWSESNSNSTIVSRNSSGYVFLNFLNISPNDVSSGVTKICVEASNDGYVRHGTAAAVRSFLNVADGAKPIWLVMSCHCCAKGPV